MAGVQFNLRLFYLSAEILEYRLYGVIQDVVFTHQPQFSCSFLSLICLSTNQNIQLIHSLLIRIEWTTGNRILMSSSHWPIYNKFPPDVETVHPVSPESSAVLLLAAVTRHGPWLQAAAERRSSAEEINKNLAENAFKDNDTSPAARTN